MRTKKSEQVTLDASHNVWLQRNLNSPLLGLNNTSHLDSAVGIQGLAVKSEVQRDAMGRPMNTPKRKSDSHEHEAVARMRL